MRCEFLNYTFLLLHITYGRSERKKRRFKSANMVRATRYVRGEKKELKIVIRLKPIVNSTSVVR